MSNDKVLEITSKMIAELSKEKPSNLLLAIRTHYDFWQLELVVLLKERNMSVHQYLSKLLIECGYENASVNKVRSYMSLVRKSKQVPIVGISEAIPPSPAQRQVVNALPAQPSPMPVASVKAIVPAVVPSKKFDLTTYPFRECEERVRLEVMAFSREGAALNWDERDDELLALYSQISRDNHTPLAELNKCFTVSDALKSACWMAFKAKCKRMEIDFKKFGYLSS